ncbi:ATP synthase d subunit [Irineochytrium annulatum]|nr:ATP synthase d subunit [Irineochytrium annulatum]
MAAAAARAAKVDFSALSAKLKPETVASVNAFRRRHADLMKTVGELKEQNSAIDFDGYERVLKNKKIVQDARKAFQSFRPATYDLTEQLRMIEQQELKAVRNYYSCSLSLMVCKVAAAERTQKKVNTELTELNQLLTNIETARPVDQLTVRPTFFVLVCLTRGQVDDVAKAYPELDSIVEKMVKRGQWRVPGYYEKYALRFCLVLIACRFGEFNVGF